ncbi:hypothetical protein [Blastococcus sp. URHD0036]|uniref:hypothetical protein n=1 Tax=Blastococcus sp. URHD0036 TaxID=1380356 RepID=UPI0012DC5C19|nr:hypothetical protein [Blastococcus sp. URHD0036]
MGRILLYELNEVPWELVDHHVARRPGGALATALRDGVAATTVCHDPVELQPWRTWPSFHTSSYTDEHRSFDLGQDPDTFRGENLWDVAAAAGKRVGLFGAMQSWPARVQPTGGFHVPDTFARTADTVPVGLQRFQRFNLAMTAGNAFSSDAALSASEMIRTGADLAIRGMTPRSVATLVRHLARERRDARHKAARPMMQVVPAFDLFWRLHRRATPDLSVFFTNHVAGMMHRYWGDAMPGYEADYRADDVFAGLVPAAMDLFDDHLGRMLRHARRSPDTTVVIASSMGQGAIPYKPITETYVVADPERFAAALGLGSVEVGLAMYPGTSLLLPDPGAAAAAASVLGALRTDLGPLLTDIRAEGVTVSFRIDWDLTVGESALPRQVRSGTTSPTSWPLEELGIETRTRLGGGNTAYHVPEGILVMVGPGLTGGNGRPEVDLLDVAPFLLQRMGVGPGASMRGDGERLHAALTGAGATVGPP